MRGSAVGSRQRPQAHGLVSTRRRQHLPIGAERHAIDPPRMAPQDARLCWSDRASDHRRTVLSALAVASMLPIGAEGHAIDRAFMAYQGCTGNFGYCLAQYLLGFWYQKLP